MVEVGQLLAGRYQVVRSIGEGGAGVVYEALHEEIGKRVALKLLHPERNLDETVTKRFLQEARAAARIGHPSIVDIYDVGRTDEDTPFLVMELLQGGSLRELLKTEGVLDVEFAAYVACQMLSALEAAHLAGIVHRDIKPENVFLAATGQQRPAVKLLDFGVSRMVSRELEDTRLTRSNMVLGTPLYMSPEQAGGARDVDQLTDVYATGVVLYECLTGSPPFVAENLLALAAMIQSEDPHPPSSLRPSLPEGLEDVVLHAMARDREDRFQAACSFLEALLPFLNDVDRALLSLPETVTSPSLVAVRERPSRQPAPHGDSSSSNTEPSSWPQGAPITETLDGKSKIETAETLEATVRDGDSKGGGAGRGRRAIYAIGGVVLSIALLVGVAFTIISQSRGRGNDEGVTPVASNVPDLSHEVDSAPEEKRADVGAKRASDGSLASKVPETVQINLKGLPTGAAVRVDGQLVETKVEGGEDICSLPREERDVSMEISAPGYRTWRGTVSARESGERRVQLRRVSAPHPKRSTKRPQEHQPPPRKLPAFGEGP